MVAKREPIESSRWNLSVEECAELVGLPVDMTYRYLAAGIIPNERVGRHYVIHRGEVERWLAEGKPKALTLTPDQVEKAFYKALCKFFDEHEFSSGLRPKDEPISLDSKRR